MKNARLHKKLKINILKEKVYYTHLILNIQLGRWMQYPKEIWLWKLRFLAHCVSTYHKTPHYIGTQSSRIILHNEEPFPPSAVDPLIMHLKYNVTYTKLFYFFRQHLFCKSGTRFRLSRRIWILSTPQWLFQILCLCFWRTTSGNMYKRINV